MLFYTKMFKFEPVFWYWLKKSGSSADQDRSRACETLLDLSETFHGRKEISKTHFFNPGIFIFTYLFICVVFISLFPNCNFHSLHPSHHLTFSPFPFHLPILHFYWVWGGLPWISANHSILRYSETKHLFSIKAGWANSVDNTDSQLLLPQFLCRLYQSTSGRPDKL